MRRALDVLADNSLLVLVFCAIGALLFAAFAPDTVVGDTWMSLVSGREIVDHGLPHVDHLTVYGAGTNLDRSAVARPSRALRQRAARRLRARHLRQRPERAARLRRSRSSPCERAAQRRERRCSSSSWSLFAAPWTWTVRAQVLVLPLFAAVVALAVDARDGLRRRSWLVDPDPPPLGQPARIGLPRRR